MKPFRRVSYLSLMMCLALLVAFACNKQTDFGSDLLGNDVLPLKFDDTLSLQVVNSSIDSVPTFDVISSTSDNILLAGNIVDPLFGKVKADAYMVFQPDRVITDLNHDNLVFDSLVLSFSIDPTNVYGDTLQPMDIKIERLNENMFTDSVIYSTRSLATLGTIGMIQGLNFTPNTTTQVIDTSTTTPDTTQVPFFLSTRLDDALGMELLQARVYDSIPKFIDLFKGIKISVENVSSLMALNIIGSSTRMVLHYHDRDADTIARNITFVINQASRRFSHFDLDHTSSFVADYQDDVAKGDTYMTLQGLSGVRPKIIFPNLDQYKGKGIKLVQLEMTVADIPGNPAPNYKEVEQMAASGITTAGKFLLIEDFVVLFNNNQLNLFGGSFKTDLENGIKVKRYTFNMTQHFIRMLQGEETNEMILSVLGGSRRANRIILNGPGHPTFPLRLKIAYSDL